MDEIFSLFVSEEVDKVELLYTKFVSLIKSEPVIHTILPLSPQVMLLAVSKHLQGSQYLQLLWGALYSNMRKVMFISDRLTGAPAFAALCCAVFGPAVMGDRTGVRSCPFASTGDRNAASSCPRTCVVRIWEDLEAPLSVWQGAAWGRAARDCSRLPSRCVSCFPSTDSFGCSPAAGRGLRH